MTSTKYGLYNSIQTVNRICSEKNIDDDVFISCRILCLRG